jgi:pimeloyl-ACP methyl ester carboxylesterase
MSAPADVPGRWPPRPLTPTGFVHVPGGPEVAWYELGGSGPPLVLVHATGFCAAVLAPMAAVLASRFRCLAVDQRAHGASGPPPGGDFAWEGFAADVLALVDQLGLEHPVGFGHSCGGAALLLAEEARPGTFAGLYCYEPVVYPGDLPLAPSVEGNPLSAGALRRRRHFPHRDAALRNFSSKAPFDRLDARVLAAYVDNGFEPDPEGGIRLRCRPEHEAQVYAHGFSHDAYARLARVRCPVTLACGEHTDAFGPSLLALLAARLAGAEQVVLDGLGHFGPLEDPAAVAGSLAGSLAAAPARP